MQWAARAASTAAAARTVLTRAPQVDEEAVTPPQPPPAAAAQTSQPAAGCSRTPVSVSLCGSGISEDVSKLSVPPPPGPWDDGVVRTAQKHYSVRQMLGLFAMSFAYGFVFNSTSTLVLPAEIQRLTPRKQSLWMSAITGAGALSQLTSPLSGAWSDRLHKRVSFLVNGSFITIAGIACYFAVRAMDSIALLFIAHVCTMVGLSIIYTILCALLNDCLLPEQQGTGSGTLAILGTFGSGAGYAMFGMMLPVEYSYCLYILTTVSCLGVCVMHVPSNLDRVLAAAARHTEKVRPVRPADCRSLVLSAVSLPSPSRHPDFALACGGRMLFNSGLASQVYMQFYFRDVVKVKNPTQMVSWVAVMALFGCAVAALPSGMLSDRVGKKPVIYAAVGTCCSAVVLFLLCMQPELFLVLGFIYGLGNVGYLSVDYALGVACLPRTDPATDPPGSNTRRGAERQRTEDIGAADASSSSGDDLPALPLPPPPPPSGVPIDAAKDLGIFAMSATSGTVIGQVVYGAVLDVFAVELEAGAEYSHFGFIVVFGLAGVCFFGAGLTARWISCVE
eukprot:TRINITY_DN2874_c5_g1_i1.p1 TRINITY_DN2874_c5_g1~~TRINITY_DN2874_c5_g1_i1.p1  ORF type:complete len:561 (+),score=149.45 TRINITY_DN2874_c5_g1_i1:109-1791(+)